MTKKVQQVLGGLFVATAAVTAMVVAQGIEQSKQQGRDFQLVFGIAAPYTQVDRAIAYPIVQTRLDTLQQEARDTTLLVTKGQADQFAATAAGFRHANAWALAMDTRTTAQDQLMEQVSQAVEPALATAMAVLAKNPKPPTGLEILKNHRQRKAPA